MTKWLRFPDLKARNIVKSWAQLRRLTEKYEFPRGRMLSPNVRAWTDDEIDEWLESRPVEGPPPRGAAKVRRDRARKAERTASATA
jgi:predicted DNA-binding transcriptional regulator AlpA